MEADREFLVLLGLLKYKTHGSRGKLKIFYFRVFLLPAVFKILIFFIVKHML